MAEIIKKYLKYCNADGKIIKKFIRFLCKRNILIDFYIELERSSLENFWPVAKNIQPRNMLRYAFDWYSSDTQIVWEHYDEEWGTELEKDEVVASLSKIAGFQASPQEFELFVRFLIKYDCWHAYIENVKKDGNGHQLSCLGTPIQWIDGAFNWFGSKEGHTYWHSMNMYWKITLRQNGLQQQHN